MLSVGRARESREILESLYAPIAEHLLDVDRIVREQLHSKVTFIEELTSRVRLYQGKKIRPALLLLAAQATGEVRREHVVLGAVIEVIHAATLVHDDLLDEATTRRHVATVQAEWGTEASVLLGDYLFSQAYYLASTIDSVEGCRTIGMATNRTCEGELHQVSRRGYFDLTEEEYVDVIAGKTAELISCSCRLGARFSGASSVTIEALARFGRNIGIAFQIADDLLDIVGETSTTGKTVGSDWEKRKVTLPFIRLRDTLDLSEVQKLRRVFDDPGNHREALLALLAGSDAMTYAKERGRQFAVSAAAELEHLPESPAKDSLLRIAEFAAHRQF